MSARRKKLKNPPAKKKNSSQQVEAESLVVQQESYEIHQGPLPSPTVLQRYDDIVPGAAERILCLAEADAQFQREITRDALFAEKGDKKRGQWMAFTLAVFSLSLAAVLSLKGHQVTASIIGGSTVVGLVSAFIYGRHTKKTEEASPDPQAISKTELPTIQNTPSQPPSE